MDHSRTSVAIGLALFATLSFATTAGADGPPSAPIEVQDDAYVEVDSSTVRTEPAMAVRLGTLTANQVNVDRNGFNIIGDAANEPSMAVDPTNRNRLTIGWRQFDTITSNFRQAGWGFSADGGRSWTFPGVLERGVFRSDPVLDFDDTGRFYYNSLRAVGLNYWSAVAP